MRICASSTRSTALAAAALLAAVGVAPRAQTTDVAWLLARVGERVAEYYKRAQNIVCTEKVLAQPIDSSYNAEGFGRSLEYELHVESEPGDDGASVREAKVARELRKVNGRLPRPKDKEGCFDPEAYTPEPLAFLLPANQSEYKFTAAGFGKGKDRNTLLLDFVHVKNDKPEFKEDDKKAPDCFQISLPLTTKGRVWIDPASYDVLRVDEQLAHRVDFRVPFEQQRKRGLPDYISVDRWETSTRYTIVKFSDPDETLLLPQSIDEVTILRGAGSHRKRQQFSDYRRFLTGGRIVK